MDKLRRFVIEYKDPITVTLVIMLAVLVGVWAGTVGAQGSPLDALPDDAALVLGQEFSFEYEGRRFAELIPFAQAQALHDQIEAGVVVDDVVVDPACNCFVIVSSGERIMVQDNFYLTYNTAAKGNYNRRVWITDLGDGLLFTIVSRSSLTRSAEDKANDVWHCEPGSGHIVRTLP